jgi:hypothetical protein
LHPLFALTVKLPFSEQCLHKSYFFFSLLTLLQVAYSILKHTYTLWPLKTSDLEMRALFWDYKAGQMYTVFNGSYVHITPSGDSVPVPFVNGSLGSPTGIAPAIDVENRYLVAEWYDENFNTVWSKLDLDTYHITTMKSTFDDPVTFLVSS